MSAIRFTDGIAVPRTQLQVRADRRAAEGVRLLGAEFRHLREDAGLSRAAVARVAGIHHSYLALIEDGRRDPSAIVRERVAAALGAESSTRLFPVGGPAIRDRFQARMLEAFLAVVAPSWVRAVEVPVQRPVGGVIDAVLVDRERRIVVAVEVHSELRRIEQQLRWAANKAEALPSSTRWSALVPEGTPPTITSVLVLRSTRATRELVASLPETFRAAYPAEPRLLRRALGDPAVAWPGAGIIWSHVAGSKSCLAQESSTGSRACASRARNEGGPSGLAINVRPVRVI